MTHHDEIHSIAVERALQEIQEPIHWCLLRVRHGVHLPVLAYDDPGGLTAVHTSQGGLQEMPLGGVRGQVVLTGQHHHRGAPRFEVVPEDAITIERAPKALVCAHPALPPTVHIPIPPRGPPHGRHPTWVVRGGRVVVILVAGCVGGGMGERVWVRVVCNEKIGGETPHTHLPMLTM